MPQPPDAREVTLARLGRLASVLSHEIRNPLETIVLNVTLLEADLQQPIENSQAEMQMSLAEIKTALARIHDLVENYLSLARLVELQRELVDLGALVETFALEMRPQCTAQGIILRLEGVATLGHICLHQHAFRRVLVNLVQNAMDAMPQGGELRLHGERQDSRICFEVQDTGAGIPADHLPLVFEPFHTTKSAGTGLGLYVAQQILEAHGGAITLTSTPGSGTTCTLTLPLMAVGTKVS